MNCNHILENLFSYAGNTLPAAERKEFEAHLSKCKNCSEQVKGFLSFESLIIKEKSVEPAPFAGTRILQRLESEMERHTYRRRQRLIHLLQPALVAASLIVAMLFGYMIGRQGGMNIQPGSASEHREQLKSDLYIHDFVDEEQSLLSNK
jgi:anti-sigma factor RsiW